MKELPLRVRTLPPFHVFSIKEKHGYAPASDAADAADEGIHENTPSRKLLFAKRACSWELR